MMVESDKMNPDRKVDLKEADNFIKKYFKNVIVYKIKMPNSLQILMPAHNEGKNIENHITKVDNILKEKLNFLF